MTPAASRTAFACLSLAAAAMALYAYRLIEADGGYHTLDDPMITLRVARVMAEHGVPYFNPTEPVAANTSLFWPILLAPVYLVIEDPQAAIFGIFLGSSALWIGMSIWTAAQLQGLATRIAVLVALAFGPWAVRYGGSTWEHVPQAALVTVGLALYWRGPDCLRTSLIAFWLLALSFVMRPDSAVLIGGFWLIAFLRLPGAERGRFVLLTLPAVVIPAAYLAGMWAAYGSFVPNTYYLKLDDGVQGVANGIAYVLSPYRSGPVPGMIVALIFASPWLAGRERIILGLACLHLAYVVRVGGDVFPFGRFFLVLMPVLSLILANVLSRLTVVVPLALAAAAAIWPLANPGYLRDSDIYAERITGLVGIAQILNTAIKPGEGSIGLHHLGIGYHMPEHHIVDFLGKADPVIAKMPPKQGRIGHNKWDYDYSLSAYDVVAAPIPAVSHETVVNDESLVLDPEVSDWKLLAQAAVETGRYSYVGPERFCFPSPFGFYIDPRFEERLTAMEVEGPDGKRCLP